MSKELEKYERQSSSLVRQSTRAIVSYTDQIRTDVELAYYKANVRGRILQIEADMILEHELGLSPRRKKRRF